MFGVTHHACEQAGELLTVDFELIQEEMEQVNALDSDNRWARSQQGVSEEPLNDLSIGEWAVDNFTNYIVYAIIILK